MTTHGGCRTFISNECTFGVLQPIYLPPHAVSIPRTEVPMEAIIGVQIKSKSTPLQRDYSCRKYFDWAVSPFFQIGSDARCCPPPINSMKTMPDNVIRALLFYDFLT